MPWVCADILRISQLCELAPSEQASCPGLQCHALGTWEVPAIHAWSTKLYGGYPGCHALFGRNIPSIGCGPSTTKLILLSQRHCFPSLKIVHLNTTKAKLGPWVLDNTHLAKGIINKTKEGLGCRDTTEYLATVIRVVWSSTCDHWTLIGWLTG